MTIETWSPKNGDPAVDATDVPKFRDGRFMKKVILVCAAAPRFYADEINRPPPSMVVA